MVTRMSVFATWGHCVRLRGTGGARGVTLGPLDCGFGRRRTSRSNLPAYKEAAKTGDVSRLRFPQTRVFPAARVRSPLACRHPIVGSEHDDQIAAGQAPPLFPGIMRPLWLVCINYRDYSIGCLSLDARHGKSTLRSTGSSQRVGALYRRRAGGNAHPSDLGHPRSHAHSLVFRLSDNRTVAIRSASRAILRASGRVPSHSSSAQALGGEAPSIARRSSLREAEFSTQPCYSYQLQSSHQGVRRSLQGISR